LLTFCLFLLGWLIIKGYYVPIYNFNLFFSSNIDLYKQILKNTPWNGINKIKKHKSLDSFNCSKSSNFSEWYKLWWGSSGVYKITFLHFKLFTYYGSSTNLGQRVRSHYYDGKNKTNFLGLFIKLFGINNFSFTIIETCSDSELKNRENWYLKTFKPLLNMKTVSNTQPNKSFKKSKIKISLSKKENKIF
jgi:hypothetical protein